MAPASEICKAKNIFPEAELSGLRSQTTRAAAEERIINEQFNKVIEEQSIAGSFITRLET